MIATLLALALIGQGQDQGEAAAVTAAPLVSKMLAKYAQAKTVVGKIVLTQVVGEESGQIETFVQFERPGLLYVRQVHKKAQPKVWLVCSTGKVFTYDAPHDLPPGAVKRLAEEQFDGEKVMDIQGVYLATSRCLGDRGAPLDIAVSNLGDLQFLRAQWATLSMAGKSAVGETEVYIVGGRWREYGSAPVSGTYQIYITADGELKRYSVRQDLMTDQVRTLVSTWDVNLTIGAKPDPALFKVYR